MRMAQVYITEKDIELLEDSIGLMIDCEIGDQDYREEQTLISLRRLVNDLRVSLDNSEVVGGN